MCSHICSVCVCARAQPYGVGVHMCDINVTPLAVELALETEKNARDARLKAAQIYHGHGDDDFVKFSPWTDGLKEVDICL